MLASNRLGPTTYATGVGTDLGGCTQGNKSTSTSQVTNVLSSNTVCTRTSKDVGLEPDEIQGCQSRAGSQKEFQNLTWTPTAKSSFSVEGSKSFFSNENSYCLWARVSPGSRHGRAQTARKCRAAMPEWWRRRTWTRQMLPNRNTPAWWELRHLNTNKTWKLVHTIVVDERHHAMRIESHRLHGFVTQRSSGVSIITHRNMT